MHKALKRHVSKENGQEEYEKCSTSLGIWEMEFKTTMRYHLTLTRIAIIIIKTQRKEDNNKDW